MRVSFFATRCIPRHRMSSWGFMGFILAVVNGVVNMANNVVSRDDCTAAVP